MKKIILLLLSAALYVARLPAQERFSDCAGAVILCDKSDIIVKKLFGVGQEKAEVGYTSCSDKLDERNTVWLKWQVGKPGAITFSIEPLEPGDDLDFVVYRLNDGITGCSRKHEIRCMASGVNIGAADEDSYPCRGRMGLAQNVSDQEERDGCGDEHDNYLAAIDALTDERYILYVNNYSSGNGFKLEWGGDATFVTPTGLGLPAVDQTRMSRAIYFKEGYHDGAFKTDWAAEPIHPSFAATMTNTRVPNTFVACLPDDENMVKPDRKEAPEIGQLYPNPTAGNAFLAINAPQAAVARVEMYDLLGRVVFSREYIIDRGQQVLSLPADQLRSGLYLCLIRTGDSCVTRKLLVSL